jgi:hypothetical protein
MDEFLPQYAAQAVIDLERAAKQCRALVGDHPSVGAMSGIAGLIRAAVHVVLPPNGEIYRSNHWGGEVPTEDEVASFAGLPAPVTCFEYPWTHPKAPTDETVGTRRITLVHDGRQTHEGPISPGDAFYTQIFSVYYHELMGMWCMYPGVVNVVQPLQMASQTHKMWSLRASYQNLDTGQFSDRRLSEYEKKCIGEFRSDITAVVQCCHALRAGASFAERRETSSSRRWKFDKRGVGGFTYHVLKLPAHVRGEGESSNGSHASPRFHIRRAHIRKLPKGTLTFVRQCFVGDKERGVVEKTYEVRD